MACGARGLLAARRCGALLRLPRPQRRPRAVARSRSAPPAGGPSTKRSFKVVLTTLNDPVLRSAAWSPAAREGGSTCASIDGVVKLGRCGDRRSCRQRRIRHITAGACPEATPLGIACWPGGDHRSRHVHGDPLMLRLLLGRTLLLASSSSAPARGRDPAGLHPGQNLRRSAPRRWLGRAGAGAYRALEAASPAADGLLPREEVPGSVLGHHYPLGDGRHQPAAGGC